MKPFIPHYITSVGEVDAFMKVSRPDGLSEELGLSALDEPTITGIDKALFSLELSYLRKSHGGANISIKAVENAHKNLKAVQTWVEQIGNLHKEKMSSNVSYSKQMPNIENLIQVWPEKMESTLKELNFPDERLSISTDNYAKVICSMLDIPIHQLSTNKGLIEALHVLFTVYLEFKDNQHFNRGNKDNVQSIKF
jgi:intraflagellar transport protein 46